MKWIGFIKSDLYDFINHKPETTCLSFLQGKAMSFNLTHEHKFLNRKKHKFHIWYSLTTWHGKHFKVSTTISTPPEKYMACTKYLDITKTILIHTTCSIPLESFLVVERRVKISFSTQQISLRHVAHKLLLDNFQIPKLSERERKKSERVRERNVFIHNKFRYLLIAF